MPKAATTTFLATLNEILNALPIAKDAPFNAYQRQHDPTCLPNTRVDLLRKINDWVDGKDSPSIFWLSGLAGTGKSTIAQTVATQYNMKSRLAASFFFSRAGGDVSHAGKFITSIAFQIANSIPGLKRKVCEAIAKHNSIANLSLFDQWQELVIVPLLNLEEQDCRSSYVIVVDALDECDGQDNIQIILQCLAEVRSLQSTPVRVLLTSRSEIPIQHGFIRVRRDDHQDFVLHDIDPAIVEHDISIFLKHKLEFTRDKYRLGNEWPAERDIRGLVERSGGLFIWAATAWRFIDEDSQLAETRILSLIHQVNGTLPPERKLDEIYTTVLANSGHGNYNEAESQTLHTLFREIVGPIVTLQDPLSIDNLAELLGKDVAVLRRTVARLNSVLHVPAAGPGTMQLLHPSFRDFILDQRRCTSLRFHIDERSVHREMYTHCLRLISKHLHRDICNLQNPGALVAELSQIDLDRYIEPHVKYACRFWVHHCIRSDVDASSCSNIEAFFHKHFLWWLETLSLLGYGSNAVHMIQMLDDVFSNRHEVDGQIILKLREKIKTFKTSVSLGANSVAGPASSTTRPSLRAVVNDAARFALAFRPMLEEAPLQLYYAGLLFSPKASIIRELFSSEAPPWLLPCLHMGEIWSPCLQTLKDHAYTVSAVAFSPDRKTLASCRNAVKLWDASSGKVLQTLKSCPRCLITVAAFSLDSKTLALGDSSGTVQLWDVGTGKVLQNLHNTRSGRVGAVAFSLDSNTLAWGFGDGTIETRGIHSSAQQKLKGHAGPVSALAFSPNGKTLVSGSVHSKLKLWDVDSGEVLLKLYHRNDGQVNALAFSPDGKTLASGFWTGFIKTWDTGSGRLLQTLSSHFSSADRGRVQSRGWVGAGPRLRVSVNALAFSPDSKMLASGSDDKTAKLWNASSGKVLQTLKGHSGPVNTVAFSPDSKTLASGSDDTAVKLWDAGSRKAPQTPQGHSGLVNALAFSPNSKLLASGSRDEKVKLWDTSSGKVLRTLKGHSGSVNALAFSPDSTTLVSCDTTLTLWDVGSGKMLHSTRPSLPPITAVAFSPDGRTLAWCRHADLVNLWDVRSWTTLKTLKSYSASISALAFSPDSKTLACGSRNETVELWDISLGKVLQTLQGHLSQMVNVLWPQLTSPLSLSVEGDWICRSEKRVLWIPSEYRTRMVAFHDNLAGFAHSSGHVSILRYVD
ncbi:Vegetative incompatibility protein [Alternaria arborescens]|nr:Vegetative incompatibility protein [Alternaria arborescens]